jgi:hypothetical protein
MAGVFLTAKQRAVLTGYFVAAAGQQFHFQDRKICRWIFKQGQVTYLAGLR